MQISGAWDRTCRCEQMPCLSSPALTFSLGRVEHGPWLEGRGGSGGLIGSGAAYTVRRDERGEGGSPSLSSALSQLIMGLIRSRFF